MQILPSQTDYALAGGMETFHRLAQAFYRRVAQDTVLRPLYVEPLDEAAERLGLFLAQYFGGPPQYSAQRGHPRLRMRHVSFPIGPAERNAWLLNMLAAMDDVGIPEPPAARMRQYFENTSTFLINQPDLMTQPEPSTAAE